jgi:hypothetical protein
MRQPAKLLATATCAGYCFIELCCYPLLLPLPSTAYTAYFISSSPSS